MSAKEFFYGQPMHFTGDESLHEARSLIIDEYDDLPGYIVDQGIDKMKRIYISCPHSCDEILTAMIMETVWADAIKYVLVRDIDDFEEYWEIDDTDYYDQESGMPVPSWLGITASDPRYHAAIKLRRIKSAIIIEFEGE